MEAHFYNGILYQIEYKPKLSNNDYTQHKVYHIKTERAIIKIIALYLLELFNFNCSGHLYN